MHIVTENSWKEAVFGNTNWVIRTGVMWRGWNSTGSKVSYLISG